MDTFENMLEVPNPGSKEAIAAGCRCPIMDNGHGRGYMGGLKDEQGRTMFVYSEGCPLHWKANAGVIESNTHRRCEVKIYTPTHKMVEHNGTGEKYVKKNDVKRLVLDILQVSSEWGMPLKKLVSDDKPDLREHVRDFLES